MGILVPPVLRDAAAVLMGPIVSLVALPILVAMCLGEPMRGLVSDASSISMAANCARITPIAVTAKAATTWPQSEPTPYAKSANSTSLTAPCAIPQPYAAVAREATTWLPIA